MADVVLVNNSEKYCGQYVATKSFLEKDVIASGSDPSKVINAAKKLGIEFPVVVFVPESDLVHIY